MPLTREQHVLYTRNEWKNGFYFTRILDILKTNKIQSMIDIGANVGEVTNILLETIPELNEIHLFEPQKDNMKFLKENIAKNATNKNINYYECGVFYGHKSALMYQDPNYRNVGGFQVDVARTTVDTKNSIAHFQPVEGEIELKTLEEFNFTDIDFVKIDVELSEYNIIENSTFLQTVKFLDIEFHHLVEHVDYAKKHFPNHEIIINHDWHVFLKRNN